MSNDLNEINEEKEQAEHLRKVYADIAKNSLKWVTGILIFDFVTYGLFAFWGYFDFGVFFEIATFAFVAVSIWLTSKYLVEEAKIQVIIAMIPIGCLLIYDLIDLFSHIGEIVDELVDYYSSLTSIFYTYTLDLVDISLLLIMLFLINSYRKLCKATGNKKYQENVDWFYDKK